ncbi:hypothetical protein [Streptomyces sp. NPDC018045]|uniref:hypothetical protein n=1 Tax=Streptomyces sp. NPDC018045 TaxID=3365037 RepID=UPI00379C0362
MRTARITAVAAGVVMMAGLTACGGKDGGNKADGGDGGSKGSPLQAAAAALRTASEKTGSENSAKVEGTNQLGGATQSLKGEMDWSNGLRMSVEMSAKGGAAAGLGGGKPMKAVYTPEAMYLNLGLGGKPWMKYDYDALAKQSAAGALIKDQMQNNNPTRSMELVIASGKAKKVGTEDVRGVQATRYTATIDVAELSRMQASKNFSEKDMKALEDLLKQSGTKNETIDLWIGPDNLLVKKREQARNNQGGMDSTVYYSDYGTKVTATEPPASQTADAAKIGAGAAGGGLAG